MCFMILIYIFFQIENEHHKKHVIEGWEGQIIEQREVNQPLKSHPYILWDTKQEKSQIVKLLNTNMFRYGKQQQFYIANVLYSTFNVKV